MDIYDKCPVLENDDYIVRLIEENDADDLFRVYSDKFALPFFNSDNCNGSNFYCEKREYVKESIKYWLLEYHENKGFVRFTIVDKKEGKAIGTIEMFRRESKDYYNNFGMLRLDVRSDHENTKTLYQILSLIVDPFYDWFGCANITTKAAIYAIDRIEALKKMNFVKSLEPLIGGDMRFNDYWIREK